MAQSFEDIEQVVIARATYIVAVVIRVIDPGEYPHRQKRTFAAGIIETYQAKYKQRKITGRRKLRLPRSIAYKSLYGGKISAVFTLKSKLFDCIEAELAERE